MRSRNTNTAISNVLLPTDFSDESAQAVDCARSLCDWYGSKLYVAHVMDLFPFSLRTDPEASIKIKRIRQQADAEMKAFVLEHHLTGTISATALLAGEPSVAIEKFTTKREIDLIAIGSKGEQGLNRLFQGSVAEEIFRTAHCPVIVVGPKARIRMDVGGFTKLLFASDLSPISRAAVPMIEFLLNRNPSATALLAHFLEEESENVFVRHDTRVRIERQLVEIISPELRSRVEAAVEMSPAPDDGMIDMVEGRAADLLVLGVRSGGAFTRAATHGLCAKTPRVISEALCPVLTIRGE
jgi:nucleotide-binding universal stress UspA family protein